MRTVEEAPRNDRGGFGDQSWVMIHHLHSPTPLCWRAALGLLLVAGATLVQAQITYPGTPSNSPAAAKPDNGYSSLTKAESRFVVRAERANTEQLAIARVAVTRATSPEVRAFAQEIVSSHESIGNDLVRLATSKTVSLEPLAADEVTRKWNDKKVANFDQDFVGTMISAHRNTVEIYEEAQRDSKDGDITNFAREQITGLKDHLYKAEQLKKAVD